MRRVLFTTFVSLLLSGIQAIAQDFQHRDTLDVAKVSADRWAPSKLTDTGFMRLESVEMKKGMALFSSPDIIKILQNSAGVAQGMELASGMYVRGGDGSDNLFLLDGVPLYQVCHLGGIFSSFNSDIIDYLEFYKSGFSADLGGRTSSVVDVHTSNGSRNDYSGSFSIGLLDGRLQFTGPIVKEKLFFNFGIRRSWIDALMVPGVAIYDKLADEHLGASYSFHDANLNLTYLLSDKDEFYVRLFSGRDKLKYSDSNPKRLYGKEIYEVTDEEKLSLLWGNSAASLSWVHKFRKSLSQDTKLYYSRGYSDIISDNKSFSLTDDVLVEGGLFERNVGDVRAVGVRSDGKWIWKDNALYYGVNFQHNAYFPQKEYSDSRSFSERYDTEQVSFYVADKLRWRRLTLNAGLHNVLFLSNGKTTFLPQPRINASYSISDRATLKASYSVMAQTEHLLSSLYFDLPTNLWMPSTTGVAPVLSSQWASGFYFSERGWRLNVEAYYKTMDNMLMYSGASSIFPPIEDWENAFAKGRGRAYGLETECSYRNERIYAGVAYTLSWSERFFQKFYDKWFYDRYDNRHKLTIEFSWSISEKVDFNANWNYHTGNRLSLPERAITNDKGESMFLFSRPYNAQLPDYHRFDLGLDIKGRTKSGKETIWNISVYNAYCRLNPIGAEFYQDKTDGKIKVKAMAIIPIIPIIPSFSYTLKF